MSAKGGRPECGRIPARAVVLVLTLTSVEAHAQQLEPRAYSPAPVGVNFAGLGAIYASGSVVADPALLIENATATLYSVVPFYGRTFGLAGRLASVTGVVPFAWANASGDVQSETHSISRSGLIDPQLRLAVNLIGTPALSAQEFRSRRPQTTLGLSFTVSAPFGQYDSAKLINLGTNRWAFRSEVGLSQPLGQWLLELYTGAWFFTANDDFYGGHVRTQIPLASYQVHVVYNFGRTHLWAAGDFTYYEGGSTTVSGQPKNDRQANTRAGLTVSVPVTSSQSLKGTWAEGVWTRVGSRFTTFGVTWTLQWR